MNESATFPSPRFSEAMAFAATKHAGQLRKGTAIPYISHPISVAALVLEDGGSEDEMIAGLFHDLVEDCGGAPVLDEIRELYGDPIANIVDGCTDAYEDPKPPWNQRKQAFLASLEQADVSVLRVVSADKLHNARSLLTDLEDIGEVLWDRFTASREQSLWYYGELVSILNRRQPSRLSRELARVVARLH